jgi:calcineurin-like phosphoesterase family protein
MHNAIINNWNSIVTPKDHIYLLGDVTFGKPGPTNEILSQLNGTKFLVKGNHDHHIERDYKDQFAWIKDYAEIYVQDAEQKHGKQMIILFHYSMRVWNRMHHGSWQLYGHSHGSLPEDSNRSMDVGMDAHNYTPISYNQIKEHMATKTYIPQDHHLTR